MAFGSAVGCKRFAWVAVGVGLVAMGGCITVEQPASEQGAAFADGDGDGDGADAGERSADGGVDTGSHPSPIAKRSANRTPSTGDGGSSTAADEQAEEGSDGGSGGETAESAAVAQQDGGGETESKGAEAAHHYCGIMRMTERVCNGSITHDYGEGCEQDEDDCLSLLPPDEEMVFSEYCSTRTEYHVFEGGLQVGTCEQFKAYWANAVECLLDKHCGEGEKCVDNACVCPDGVACQCPNCSPQPASCEGQVLVEQIGSGPCDENRQCSYQERRTDCAAQGLECSESSNACVEPSNPPPPPAPGI